MLVINEGKLTGEAKVSRTESISNRICLNHSSYAETECIIIIPKTTVCIPKQSVNK
jgi:hypothetical protein